MKILLTAFEPFGGKHWNASREAIIELSSCISEPDWKVFTLVLPVIHDEARLLLEKILVDHQPDIVLCFGEAGGRAKISLERIAINLCDFLIPDNSGNFIHDMPLIEGGVNAYFTTLPIRGIETELRTHGFPVEISLSAGTYLCNEVFYFLMDYLRRQGDRSIGGFIHLPMLPGQAAVEKGNLPSMSPMETREAVVSIMKVCSRYMSDRFGMGL